MLYNITTDNALDRQLLENGGLVNENFLDEENVPVDLVGNMSGANKGKILHIICKCKVIVVFCKYNF